MAAGDAKPSSTALRCGAASLFVVIALLACWAIFPALHLLIPAPLFPLYNTLTASLSSSSPPYGSAFAEMLQADQQNDEQVARTTGLHSYSQPLVRGKPEFECTHTYYFPCTREDKAKGPPLHMLAPGGLSADDRAMLLALRRFRRQREEGARRVASEQRKVAFLFLTKGPLPMAPLWERFFKGHEGRYSVYVHTTPGFKYPPTAPTLFRDSQIRSEHVAWGSPTMVDAERRLLAMALADPANHRFVLLSESCIPVKGFEFMWDYLMSTRFSFVANYYTKQRVCAGRYHKFMAPVINGTQWRKGLQWFSATRRHVNLIIEDDEVYDKFEKYCRGDKWHHHCYPDEHYIQTLLNIKDPQWIANRTITFTDFSQFKEHPRTFYRREVHEGLIRYITEPHHMNPRNKYEDFKKHDLEELVSNEKGNKMFDF